MAFELVGNRNVLEMEYAVRGPIPQRAAELAREGRRTIPCNIGNPQALGQRPLTFHRRVLSLLEDPDRIARERTLGQALGAGELEVVSSYELKVAERMLRGLRSGVGAYTESAGPEFIREAVARFIDARDGGGTGGVPRSDPAEIFLTNGASEAARHLLEILIAGPRDGIMIPIPQYPLYSATVARCGGASVGYYPDEEAGWALERSQLESAHAAAQADGIAVKAIVVINPGNPTGALLPRSSVEEIVAFAEEHQLAIIADEVYQENVYGGEFVSFARVLGERNVPLLSLHSVSKGYCGECGHRGGYLEVRNSPRIKGSSLSLSELVLKQASVSLCSNTMGQALTYLMVSPPPEDCEPGELFRREKDQILGDLHAKAEMIRQAFQEMRGVECFGRIGAMYLFPRLGPLPEGKTDFDYCMSLLEETGLCTVNGSGFGQAEGTHHLRIAFLPERTLLEEVLPEWVAFHNGYVAHS